MGQIPEKEAFGLFFLLPLTGLPSVWYNICIHRKERIYFECL